MAHAPTAQPRWRAPVVLVLASCAALASWLSIQQCGTVGRLDELRPAQRRVVVVLADGLDRTRLAESRGGGAPQRLRARLAQGVVGDLYSEPAPAADFARACATALTGVMPEVHGVRASTRRDPRNLRERAASSLDLRAPLLWEYLSHAGVECVVVGLPASSPARWILGSLATDRFFEARRGPADPAPRGAARFPTSSRTS
jgi:predicted AlkP superfamily phosphohydrolase/phosphomutase